MRRILCALLAVFLLLPALAEEDELAVLLDRRAALQTQQQAVALELEIAALNIQLAEVQGDADARAAAVAEQERLLALQDALQEQETQLCRDILSCIEVREAELAAEHTSLQAQLDAVTQAQLELAAIRETLPGVVVTGSAYGFSSIVTVTVTMDASGKIRAIEADTSGETRGFGTRVMTDAAFLQQFIGMTLPVDPQQVDVLSGATYSSNAVIAALNKLITTEKGVTEESVAEPVTVVETRTGRAEGFMGYVVVTVGLAEDGAIATLEIDVSNELPPACNLVLADSFISQFIGRKGPFVVGEGVDVATGATFSSNGVIEALNKLYEK